MAPTDPYTPPTSDVDAGQTRKRYSDGGAALIIVFTALIHYLGYRFAAGFAELFQGFGAESPRLTRFFLPGSVVFYVLPGLSVLSYLLRWRNAKVGGRLLIGTAIATVLIIPAFFFALYLPVLKLGAVQ